MDRLDAINASFAVIPPQVRLTSFIAMANGWKPESAKVENLDESSVTPGGNLVHLFPDGVIRVG